jgi:O-antigen/teichoic acid export membrane protein
VGAIYFRIMSIGNCGIAARPASYAKIYWRPAPIESPVKVLTNAFWLSFCRIAADLLSFVLFAVISRTFGPGGTGEYSYAFAVATLVALTVTAGFEDYGIRQYARALEHDRPQLWRDILSTQCVQLLLGLAALVIFLLASSMSASGLLVIVELSIYVIGWTISYTFFVPAMASQSMVRPAVTDLVCRLTAIVGALVWASVAHPSLPWLLAGFPVAGVVLASLALRSAKQHGASLRPARNWRGVLRTWRGTSAFAGAEILNQFYARADLLLIAYFLGNAQVGLYATDIKFVEVGILPLVLLGTAAYPLLSRHAAHDLPAFENSARDFTRIVYFFSGWLAVGIYCLIPLLIVPLFGARFAPSAALLPWFALFAVMKGWEVAFYRLLYSVRRQMFYCGSLIVGTVVIVLLNFQLIPAFGILGAIVAAIISIIVVDLICAWGLRRQLGSTFLISAFARLALALGVTAAVAVGAQKVAGAGPWSTALVACGLFPLLGILFGLVPHPRRSLLLRQPHAENP